MGRPRKVPIPIETVAEPTLEGPTGVRGILAEVLAEEATIEGVRSIIREAINAETAVKVQCPDCGTEFRPKVPDTKKAADTLIALLEQNEGKAGERPPNAVQVIIERPPL